MKYCTRVCQNTVARARQTERERAKKMAGGGSAYRGHLFTVLRDSGMGIEAIEAGRNNIWIKDQVFRLNGETPANATITSAMRAMREWAADEERAQGFELTWTVRVMLMLHRDPPPKTEGPALEAWLTEAADSFFSFEATFWQLPSGGLYLRKLFHRRWIIEVLRAVAIGGKLLILSPPRHGKTELLQHLCVWLICRQPNIRIIWVGPNGDIAEETVRAVRDTLESSDELRQAVLGPGRYFRPQARQASSWSDKRFTVATRTAVGMKAPTMSALGRATKVISKDADLIIGDDLEDHESTATPGPREDTRTWFLTQLDSRKQKDTAWFCIGSRQHPDDLWGYLIDDDTWAHIVETAHDPLCQLDPYDIAAHVDCMLFPEVNDYRWLYEKWQTARSIGLEHLYEMVYLNNPRPEGMMHWTREIIKPAYNPTRGLGMPPLENEWFLIGGLDPAATRFQAAFLWAVELIPPRPAPGSLNQLIPGRMCQYMVDTDNRIGGGIDAFIDGPGQDWLTRFGLRHWAVEYNLYRHVFTKNQRLMDWCATNNVVLDSIMTQGANKNDPTYGVGGMRSLFLADPIEVDLPYRDAEAQAKTEVYTIQMLRYTDDPVQLKKRTTDLLMASWFPQQTIRRYFNEMLARFEDQGFLDEFSYPDYDISDYNEAPW